MATLPDLAGLVGIAAHVTGKVYLGWGERSSLSILKGTETDGLSLWLHQLHRWGLSVLRGFKSNQINLYCSSVHKA